jgi:hypothetical protein
MTPKDIKKIRVAINKVMYKAQTDFFDIALARKTLIMIEKIIEKEQPK